MPFCEAFGCHNRTKSSTRSAADPNVKEGVSFHRFPQDVARRAAWIRALRRDKWKGPSSQSRICSDHFEADDYEIFHEEYRPSKKILKKSAVPSVFEAFPKHLQKSTSRRKSPCKRKYPTDEPPRKKRRVGTETTAPNLGIPAELAAGPSGLSSPPHASENVAGNLIPSEFNPEIPIEHATGPSGLSSPTDASKNIAGDSVPSEFTPQTPIKLATDSTGSSTPLIDASENKTVDSIPSESSPGLLPVYFDEEIIVINFPDNEVEVIPDIEVVESVPIKPDRRQQRFEHEIHNYCRVLKESPVIITKITAGIHNEVPKHRACTPPKKTSTTSENQQENVKRGRKKGGRNRGSNADTPVKKKLRKKLAEKNRSIKNLRMQNLRKQKRIAKLTSVLRFLKQNKYVNGDDLQVLEDVCNPNRELLEKQLQFMHVNHDDLALLKSNDVNKEFLERQLNKAKGQKNKRKYGSPLRSFALTLHYLSPRGYKYVRKTFDCCLPHPKTLYKWYQHVDGSPGFTAESFEAVKAKQDALGKPIVGSLLIDEMSIRKGLETDGHKYYGHEDFGNGAASDSTELANSALVIMLNCVNGSWKLPLGYFLTSGVTGQQKATLVEQCLRYLHEKDIKVVSLTSDAPSSNIAMMTALGCDFKDPENLKTWFPHPCSKEKIHVFWDACHMIKLVRNTIGDKKVLYDPLLGTIKWEYFAELNKLQEEMGLHLANKVTAKHILFHKKVMNVKLAVQILSSSTADAFQFLKDNNIEGFEDVEATIEFCRIFDSLFDILNSRNLKQPGLKKPMTKSNFSEIKEKLLECKAYILRLQALKKPETSILKTKRFTGFLGLLVDIDSIINLFESLCMGDSPILQFLPAYKFSQDHLEIFFGCIRMSCGCNNNPTARQFSTAYRKNLVHMELKMGNSGNCTPLENITVLTCTSAKKSKSTADPEKCINLSAAPDLEDSTFHKLENDFDDLVLISELTNEDINSIFSIVSDLDNYELREYHTACIENIVYHISGAIVNILKKRIKCKSCKDCLASTEPGRHSSLTSTKNRGGLNHPCNDVLVLTRLCEKVLRIAFPDGTLKSQSQKFSAEKLAAEVMQVCADSDLFSILFKKLDDHLLDLDPIHNHKYYLCKTIAMKYFLIRTHFMCKNAVPTANSKRQIFNKLVLFAGQ